MLLCRIVFIFDWNMSHGNLQRHYLNDADAQCATVCRIRGIREA